MANDSLPVSVQLRLEEVCARFESDWKAAGSAATAPRIEEHLGTAAEPERTALFRELLRLDVYYRRRLGENPDADYYAARCPADADAVRALFAELFSVPQPPRQAAPMAAGNRDTRRPGPAVETGVDPARTGPVQTPAQPETTAAEFPAIPNYEILGELGRGGMGVVYKARQRALKRLVALKMILSGDLASPQELGRFRREAEAVARLQHPNIVQVYEVGEYGGRPFFSLEFVNGGTLATYLGKRLPGPKQAAALVRKLARAMHAVHECSVVHRDLKPANVLLTANGAPKITDFGLAKKLDEDAGQTHSGAIMGTPSYMAPEQASGGTARATPLADVYALGAILYECLTARPPFKAATVARTLRQVLEDEPVAPRRLKPAVPRDLETICLKCLEKKPAKRYATAKALAEDLDNWLAGRPIVARPAGRVERLVKWARRRPTVAALLAGLVLALTLGTALTAYFKFVAERRTQDAKASAELASETEEQKNEEKRKRMEEEQKANEVRKLKEATQARTLLLALGHQPNVPPNDSELEALWQLAESPSDNVRLLFIEYALQQPERLRQLRNRKELALHAAVGLDRERRQRIENLVLARLQDHQADRAFHEDCALVGIALGEVSPAFVTAAYPVVVDGIDKSTDQLQLSSLARALTALAGRLDPKEAAGGARAVVEAMSKTNDPTSLSSLTQALVVLAGRLGPTEAARALVEGMEKANMTMASWFNPRPSLAQALAALANRLEPGAAAATARRVVEVMGKSLDPNALPSLENALAALVGRLDGKEVAIAARRVIEAIKESGNQISISRLALALAVFAGRLEAKEAEEAAAAVIEAMRNPSNSIALPFLEKALAALGSRLEPKEAAVLARPVVEAIMKNPDDPSVLSPMALALAALAGRLEAKEAAAAARTVAEALTKPHVYPDSMVPLAQALAALAGRLEPQAAGATARRVVEAMEKGNDLRALPSMEEALTALAGQLEPKEVAATARTVVEAIRKQENPSLLTPLAQALAALAGRLEGKEAAAAAAAVLDSMGNPKNMVARPSLSKALAVLTGRLEATAAAAAATTVVEAMRNRSGELPSLAQALAALAGRLNEKDATTAAFTILEVLSKLNGDFFSLPSLAEALAALADRMEGRAAEAAAWAVVEAMNKAIDNPLLHHRTALPSLTKALAALRGRLEPKKRVEAIRKKAEAAASAVVEAMGKDPDIIKLFDLLWKLSWLVGWLEPGEASRQTAAAARAVLKAIGQTQFHLPGQVHFSGGPSEKERALAWLVLLADRLQSREAAAVGRGVVEAMGKPTNASYMLPLVELLAALGGRLESAEAARETSAAAGIVVEAMAREKDPKVLPLLAQGLEALAVRLEAKEAADRAVAIAHPLDGMPFAHPKMCMAADRAVAIAQGVAGELPPGTPLSGMAAIVQGSKPLPNRWSEQELVDLLKRPTCVGPAREVVLRQLGQKCNRHFASVRQFVDWAHEHQPELDLTTPPRR
jgi:hypothetical protein